MRFIEIEMTYKIGVTRFIDFVWRSGKRFWHHLNASIKTQMFQKKNVFVSLSIGFVKKKFFVPMLKTGFSNI